MPNRVERAEGFLALREKGLNVVDVRTPAEYASGHIPGAVNIPLFGDDERRVVGTIYKQKGRNEAILEGLSLVGPRMRELADRVMERVVDNTVLIYCWRGGMRSSSVAWLMNLVGVGTVTLYRGYKGFRRHVLESFLLPLDIRILGGRTGSGKTEILTRLAEKNEQIIDLEKIARHKGSAFGGVGSVQDLSQEMFENLLALDIRKTSPDKPVWIEDESRLIGKLAIPDTFWKRMRTAPVYYIEVEKSDRVGWLSRVYGRPEYLDEIKKAIENIQKKLGDERYRSTLKAVNEGDMSEAVKACLDYYDRTYEFGLSKRNPDTIHNIKIDQFDFDLIAEKLIQVNKEIPCQTQD